MAKSGENVAKVRHVVVEEDSTGQRIDNFLLKQLKGVPKSWVYRVLRRGEVRVNKGRAKPTRKLLLGDIVRIPPVRMAERKSTEPHDGVKKLIHKSILFEDELLLVINKPSGIAVHGGSGVSHGVIEILRSLRPDAPYLELAHRLDRDTSGCLMIAKKRSVLKQLQELQLKGKVDKRYLALLGGRWRKGKTTVDAPLKKNTLRSGERFVRVDPEGKDSITHFTVQQRFNDSMLVECLLETGRTHQIRVHALHLGTPIVGDNKYGNEVLNRQYKSQGMSRLFLHAWRLKMPWPDRPGGYTFEAPLPAELSNCLDELKRNA